MIDDNVETLYANVYLFAKIYTIKKLTTKVNKETHPLHNRYSLL